MATLSWIPWKCSECNYWIFSTSWNYGRSISVSPNLVVKLASKRAYPRLLQSEFYVGLDITCWQHLTFGTTYFASFDFNAFIVSTIDPTSFAFAWQQMDTDAINWNNDARWWKKCRCLSRYKASRNYCPSSIGSMICWHNIPDFHLPRVINTCLRLKANYLSFHVLLLFEGQSMNCTISIFTK